MAAASSSTDAAKSCPITMAGIAAELFRDAYVREFVE
jgi:hypothetical protein